MPRVLVTDSSERSALAVIRSLGKRGIEVVAAECTSINAGFMSKYCSRRIVYPAPQSNKKRFTDWLLLLVKREDFDLLIPITDFTVVPILERKDEFEKYVKVAAPPYHVALKALDKVQTVEVAKKCGVPVPKSVIVTDVEDIRETASYLEYPVVIKPRMKVYWNGDRAVVLKVTHNNYAQNEQDLVKKFAKIISRFGKRQVPSNFFIIQELAKGVSYGVEVLMSNSKLSALFMHKRLREYPITGGASTLRMSVWNKRLAYYAIRILKEMSWEGVAMVEFKLDEQIGDANLIEVNGRFWGSLPLAINSGVDFPYLLYKVTVENEHVNPLAYLAGVKQCWFIPGEILWLYAAIITKRGFLKTIRDFLGSFALRDDFFSLEDPAPVIGALKTSIRDFNDFLKGKRTIAGEIF